MVNWKKNEIFGYGSRKESYLHAKAPLKILKATFLIGRRLVQIEKVGRGKNCKKKKKSGKPGIEGNRVCREGSRVKTQSLSWRCLKPGRKRRSTSGKEKGLEVVMRRRGEGRETWPQQKYVYYVAFSEIEEGTISTEQKQKQGRTKGRDKPGGTAQKSWGERKWRRGARDPNPRSQRKPKCAIRRKKALGGSDRRGRSGGTIPRER